MAAIPVFESWDLIDIDQVPTQISWRLPTLYKLDAKGKVRMWEIGFDGNINSLVTRHGLKTGKITTTPPKEVKLNSSGRSMLEQALLRVRREFNDKIREDYDLDEEPEPGKFAFMKAIDHDKVKEIVYPHILQLKIDGIRCGTFLDENEVEMITRNKERILHFAKFRSEIKHLFEFLPPEIIIDGEICDREGGREKTNSVVRSKKSAHPDEDNTVYYIFDLYDGGILSYQDRYSYLMNASDKYKEKYGEPTTFGILFGYTVNNWEEVENMFRLFAEKGEEGVVLKDPRAVYKPGRNKHTIKYKVQFEEEATILEVHDSEGNEKGCATFTCLDDTGKKFDLRPGGTFEQRKEWLLHPELVLGHRYSFRYNCRSVYGVPVHPRGLSLCFDK